MEETDGITSSSTTKSRSATKNETLLSLDVSSWATPRAYPSKVVLFIAFLSFFISLIVLLILFNRLIGITFFHHGLFNIAYSIASLIIAIYMSAPFCKYLMKVKERKDWSESRRKMHKITVNKLDQYIFNYDVSAVPLAHSLEELQSDLQIVMHRKSNFYLTFDRIKQAVLMLVLCIVMILSGIGLYIYFHDFIEEVGDMWIFEDVFSNIIWFLLMGIIFGLIVGGLRIIMRIPPLLRKNAESVLESDEDLPVIFLRSFQDDKVKVDIAAAPVSDEPGERVLKEYGKIDLEVLLTSEAEKIGPFVAIGEPGEWTPLPGAFRAYFSDEEWQPAIQKWMEKARVIIILAGITEMVGWEIGKIVNQDLLEKTIIIFPLNKKKRRWNVINEALEVSNWGDAVKESYSEDLIALQFLKNAQVLKIVSSRSLEQIKQTNTKGQYMKYEAESGNGPLAGSKSVYAHDAIDYVLAFRAGMYSLFCKN
jgi:Ca2+/Na+ antiporter